MESDEIDFVFGIYSEIFYRLENSGLVAVKSCSACLAQKVRSSLDELLEGDEGAISHAVTGLARKDCNFCESTDNPVSTTSVHCDTRSEQLALPESTVSTNRTPHSVSASLPVFPHTSYSGRMSKSQTISYSDKIVEFSPTSWDFNGSIHRSSSVSGKQCQVWIEAEGKSLPTNNMPVCTSEARRSGSVCSSFDDSVKKHLNLSVDIDSTSEFVSASGVVENTISEDSVQSFAPRKSESSGLNNGVCLFSDSEDESTGSMPVHTSIKTIAEGDHEDVTSPPLEAALTNHELTVPMHNVSSDADEQFEAFLCSTRQTLEKKCANKAKPSVLGLDKFIVSDSDDSVEILSGSISPERLPIATKVSCGMSVVINLDSFNSSTPISKGAMTTQCPKLPDTHEEEFQFLADFVSGNKKKTRSGAKSTRKSIQAFILSDECGEIVEEELEGEGENELVIIDERDPDVITTTNTSGSYDATSPLPVVTTRVFSPVNILNRLILPPVDSEDNFKSPASSKPLLVERRDRENVFKTPVSTTRKKANNVQQSVSKQQRSRLAKEYFEEFNSVVFQDKLPGDLLIVWNGRMTKTAGFCKYHSSDRVTIELSNKVCDIPDRIRQTLLHEMCHAAVWLIDGKRDGHGPYWRAWAARAMEAYPGIEVSRCHSFDIKAKFLYKCTQCDYSLRRHSKSVILDKNVCPYCCSSLSLYNSDGTPYVARKPSGFAAYVKENYRLVKQDQQSLPHGDIMKQLSAKFKSCSIK